MACFPRWSWRRPEISARQARYRSVIRDQRPICQPRFRRVWLWFGYRYSDQLHWVRYGHCGRLNSSGPPWWWPLNYRIGTNRTASGRQAKRPGLNRKSWRRPALHLIDYRTPRIFTLPAKRGYLKWKCSLLVYALRSVPLAVAGHPDPVPHPIRVKICHRENR